MKTLKLATLLLAGTLLFGSTSCKYEEGPSISLRTKKARVAGEWGVEKAIEADGTVDTDWDGYTYTFDKDGGGKIEVKDGTFSYSADFEWEFISSKEKMRLTFDGESDENTILRLTNKEMWLKDADGYEIHFEAK